MSFNYKHFNYFIRKYRERIEKTPIQIRCDSSLKISETIEYENDISLDNTKDCNCNNCTKDCYCKENTTDQNKNYSSHQIQIISSP